MKIEKLDDNKIRITLNIEDLKEQNIDFQNFMSNSIDSQDFFWDMLEKAEKEIGFVTKDYKVRIEALATTTGNFILTVTRFIPESDSDTKKRKKVHIKRKCQSISKNLAIYRFDTFDDFISFCYSLDSVMIKTLDSLIQKISLYLLNDNYYLVFNEIIPNIELLKGPFSLTTEFGTYIHNSELFEKKLLEYGNVIIPDKAIKTAISFFN